MEKNWQAILVRNQMGSGSLGFLANPQLSTDLVCLYQPPFELG